jgi:hypothetical protein
MTNKKSGMLTFVPQISLSSEGRTGGGDLHLLRPPLQQMTVHPSILPCCFKEIVGRADVFDVVLWKVSSRRQQGWTVICWNPFVPRARARALTALTGTELGIFLSPCRASVLNLASRNQLVYHKDSGIDLL